MGPVFCFTEALPRSRLPSVLVEEIQVLREERKGRASGKLPRHCWKKGFPGGGKSTVKAQGAGAADVEGGRGGPAGMGGPHAGRRAGRVLLMHRTRDLGTPDSPCH